MLEKSEQINAKKTEIKSEEFLTEIKETMKSAFACRSKELGGSLAFEEQEIKINECLLFLKNHSDEIEQALFDGDINAFALISQLYEYSRQKLDEKTALENEKKKVLLESISVGLLSFLNKAADTLQQCIDNIFSKTLKNTEERDKMEDILNLLSHFLTLSMGKYVEKQELSILNAVRIIKSTSSALDSYKKEYRKECPSSIGYIISEANTLLLRIGDPKVIREFITDFLEKKDGEKSFFYTFSLDKLFPNDGRTVFWNMSIGEKLGRLNEPDEPNSSKYSDKEIKQAREILSDIPRTKVFQEILAHYHLPLYPTMKIWEKSNDPEEMGSWCRKNLIAIRNIEQQQKKSSQTLFYKNGVRCFARYDEKFLLEQAIPLAKNEPYGVMGTQYYDWNGAFAHLEREHWKINHESKQNGMRMRIFEYDDAGDIYDWLSAISPEPTEKGGERKKAKYVIINQHGDATKTDEQKERIKKNWQHVLGLGKNRESLAVEHGAPVVLVMCSGGTKDNVADVIAQEYREYGISATGASNTTAGTPNIIFKKDKETEKLSIDVFYYFSETDPDYKNGKTIRYEYDKNGNPKI